MAICNRVVFSRGTGLGNKLFPWSRCVVASHLSGEPMLAPRWWWPLRRGSLRSPHVARSLLIGVFRPRRAEIAGVRRLWIETFANTRDFTGEADRFAGVAPHRALLHQAFRESTRPRWLRVADAWRDVPIGLHVRLGDFRPAADPGEFMRAGALRTPLAWFRDMLRLARSACGSDRPAVIVSDGSAHELGSLLQEPNVRLLAPSTPASDMLVLAQCRLLIGSGGSSFSAWAAFFGDVPIFTIPGQSASWFRLDAAHGLVGTCDPAEPGDDFLKVASSL